MSYCRWSSDNWSSDIYCYEDCAGGFTIHVAGNRIVGDVPQCDLALLMVDGPMWEIAHRKQMDFMKDCAREDITLPLAGETIRVADAEDCFGKLMELRGIGYRVPQYALDALAEESLPREGE